MKTLHQHFLAVLALVAFIVGLTLASTASAGVDSPLGQPSGGVVVTLHGDRAVVPSNYDSHGAVADNCVKGGCPVDSETSCPHLVGAGCCHAAALSDQASGIFRSQLVRQRHGIRSERALVGAVTQTDPRPPRAVA